MKGRKTSNDPAVGYMRAGPDFVTWYLEPGEARELADFFEESSTSEDMARQDVAALREAADMIESRPRLVR